MAEDPEEMLPEQGLATGGGRDEDRAEEAVEHEEDHPDGEGREGQEHQELRDQ